MDTSEKGILADDLTVIDVCTVKNVTDLSHVVGFTGLLQLKIRSVAIFHLQTGYNLLKQLAEIKACG